MRIINSLSFHKVLCLFKSMKMYIFIFFWCRIVSAICPRSRLRFYCVGIPFFKPVWYLPTSKGFYFVSLSFTIIFLSIILNIWGEITICLVLSTFALVIPVFLSKHSLLSFTYPRKVALFRQPRTNYTILSLIRTFPRHNPLDPSVPSPF